MVEYIENYLKNYYKEVGLFYRKDELLNFIDEYKDILNNEIISYLNSLVNLEFSAFKEDILSFKTMELLEELKLYRFIVLYNIYHRSLNLFKKDTSLRIQEFNDKSLLEVSFNTSSIIDKPIFKLSFDERKAKAIVNIYETIENKEARERQLKVLYNKKKILEDSLYKRYNTVIINEEIDPFYNIEFELGYSLMDVKKKIKLLSERTNLSESDKEFIKKEENFKNLVFSDFSIKEEELKEEEQSAVSKYINLKNNELTELNKSLTIEYPHSTIYKKISFY